MAKKSALTHQAITLQVFYFILITKLSHAEASEDPIQRYVNIMILLKYLPQLSSSRLCLLALTTTTPLFYLKKIFPYSWLAKATGYGSFPSRKGTFLKEMKPQSYSEVLEGQIYGYGVHARFLPLILGEEQVRLRQPLFPLLYYEYNHPVHHRMFEGFVSHNTHKIESFSMTKF